MGIRSYLKERRLRGLEAFSGEKSLFLTSTLSNGIWKRIEFDPVTAPVESSTLLALEGDKLVLATSSAADIPYSIPRTIGTEQTWDWSAIEAEIYHKWIVANGEGVHLRTEITELEAIEITMDPSAVSRKGVGFAFETAGIYSKPYLFFEDEFLCRLPINMNDQSKIINLLDPTALQDGATKNYVDLLPNFPITITRTLVSDIEQGWDYSTMDQAITHKIYTYNDQKFRLEAASTNVNYRSWIEFNNDEFDHEISLTLFNGGVTLKRFAVTQGLCVCFAPLDMSTHRIESVGDAINDADATNKAWVVAYVAAQIAAIPGPP